MKDFCHGRHKENVLQRFYWYVNMLFSLLLNLLCDDISSKVQDDDLKMKKRNLKKKTKNRKEWSGMTWNYFHLGDVYLFLFCFCRCLLVRHTSHSWKNFYGNLRYCCRVCQRKCLHRSAIWYLASSVSQIHWWSSHHSNWTKWRCCIPPVCVCACACVHVNRQSFEYNCHGLSDGVWLYYCYFVSYILCDFWTVTDWQGFTYAEIPWLVGI